MFTDMVGYTALGQRNESLSLALVEDQRKLLRPIFGRHRGREVKTMGDAFLVEFPSALEAVRCAYDIQRATREFNVSLPEERRIHLRVGIHVGDVVESDGDISGDAVNVASRIEPLAEDGGVCLTRQVYDHVQGKFDLPLAGLGTKSLKNVSSQLEVYRMVLPWDERKVITTTQLDKRRIAVLPFANISQDPNDEYFADGMTEELITAMSGLQGLQVIARTSVMNYKAGGTKLSTIGNDLKVGTVLEGSVRKAGNRVRVTAQLIDVPTESHLWSEKYDRELDDIFKIQDEIAGNIAQALKVRLVSTQESGRRQTENMEAYTLYLRGRALWNKRSKEGVLQAVNLFQDAIKMDPSYSRAYSGLADAYVVAADNDFVEKVEGRSKGRQAVMRALELDDSLPEAHASLGLLHMTELEFQEAQRELKRAIELNPNYASAHQWYSNCLASSGNLAESIEEIKKARELDPLSPVITMNLADRMSLSGKVDEALALIDGLIEREPTYAWAHQSRALFYALKNMREKALAAWESQYKVRPDEVWYKLGLAWFHAWFGDEEEFARLIDGLLQKEENRRTYSGVFATCYATLGERDEFFKWADIAIADKAFDFSDLRWARYYDKVRDDPRFPKIFEKVGLTY
jgi:adenylate cyclase